MDFELNQKIDILKLQNILIGVKNVELQNYLSEEINKLLKNQSKDYPTYEKLFSSLCPKISFKRIEKLCEDFNENIKRELKNAEILNVKNNF